MLADDHKRTEALPAASGLPVALLRNGWHTESHLAALPAILAHGAVIDAAGEGRISLASRADLAEAAGAVLRAEEQAGHAYELAGNESWSLEELAAEIARQAGKPIAFHNMPQADHEAALKRAGLPDGLARLLADARAAGGALLNDGRDLSRPIGRATTPMRASVAALQA